MIAPGAVRLGACLVLLLGLPASEGLCEQTRLATSTPTELERGEAQGVAVSSRGRLFLAPRITPIGQSFPGAVPSYVLAAREDDAGNVYLGTGPDGQIVRIRRGGNGEVLFRASEPLVTALLPLPAGELLAATAPGGRIYKVRPDGTGQLWCQTEERYVWALAAGPDGSVLAATGDRGRLLKIDRNGNSRVFFDGDEAHLVSLAVSKSHDMWVGGSGRGLVYKIDPEGRGTVVYDDELPEAKSIAVDPEGNLIVAFDAPPTSDKRPPALRLRVAGRAAGTTETMTELDSRQTPALQGVIEGLPSYADDESIPLRGKVVRLAPDGEVTEIWRSRTEAAFAVALDDRGRAVFATGEPAKLWRVEGKSETALLATLDEAQATAFAPLGSTLVLATSNPLAVYRVENVTGESGTYLAPPADAGSVARWGTIGWHNLGTEGRVELFTRTGNCEDPDGTWSPWSAAHADAAGSRMTNPEGRYCQWRARLASTAGDGPRIDSVTANYATRNRPPTIRDLRIDPATAAVSAKGTLRYSFADPDGDDVAVTVQARRTGTAPWKNAVANDPPSGKPSDPSLGNDGSSKDGKAVWDTASWDEGVYEVRAVASDQPSNPPSEGLEAETSLGSLVRVDRTPPKIEARRKGDTVEVVVEESVSNVAGLEVVAEGRVLFSPRCGDGVCDSAKETFSFVVPKPAPAEAWTLRASDAAGNTAELPVPAP